MEKKQALLEFLASEGEEYSLEDIEQFDDYFTVNPHKTRFGTSPREIRDNAKRVRAVLSELFPTVKPEKWNSSRINERVYRILDRRLKAKIWPVPQEQHDNNKAHAYQDIVNFVYHLYSDMDHCEGYQEQARKAFDTGDCEEYRKLTSTQDSEYIVLTEEEAEEKAAEYIRESVWAFNSWFLLDYVPEGVTTEAIEKLQEHCEGANDPLLSMIEDFDEFVSDAIAADGLGHFLSSYDGDMHEHGDFVIFRTN